ncbi:MAG: ABC transporter ATP-binding protein, partial [Bdellovibrio bacteriovorus]
AGIERLAEGRTLVTIAHRAASIRAADRVLVLQQGQVVESGPPQELAHRDGPYRRLVLGPELGA